MGSIEGFFADWMRVAPKVDLGDKEQNSVALDVLKILANLLEIYEENEEDNSEEDSETTALIEAAYKAIYEHSKNCVLGFAICCEKIAREYFPDDKDDSPKARWYRFAVATEICYDVPPALLHAVTLLRALHDLHRGECQMVEVLDVKEKDEKYIFEVEDTEAVLAPGRFLWTPIPWFKKLSNDALRNAFLTFGESGKFMVLQQDLIKTLLGDLTTSIQFVRVKMRTPWHTTEIKYKSKGKEHTSTNENTPHHWVIRVVDKEKGRPYAVDLFGDEFGHDDKVMHWTYFSSQLNTANVSEPSSFEQMAQAYSLGLIKTNENPTATPADKVAIRALKLRLDDWLMKNEMTLQKLLNLDDEDFAVEIKGLLTSVHDGMRSTMQLFKRQGRFYWYKDEKGQLQLTKGMDDVRKYCKDTFLPECRKAIKRLRRDGNWGEDDTAMDEYVAKLRGQ